MWNMKYHYKLRIILDKLDFGKIVSNPTLVVNYGSATQSGYSGNTVFEGKRDIDDKKWLSLNIIGCKNYLFLHTNLKIKSANINSPSMSGFCCFKVNKNTKLFCVGKLDDTVQNLVDIIETQIFPFI